MTLRIVTCSASSIEGIRNFGDELLSELYGFWITTTDVPAAVSHLSVTQLGTLSGHDREALDAASCLIFTGGGYFADGDTGRSHRVRRHLRALRNRQVYRTVFKRAQRRGIPCAVLGLEVGPLANWAYRRTVRQILAAAEMVVVRNEKSRRQVDQLLGAGNGARMHLDSALALDRAELDDAFPKRSPSLEDTLEDREETRIGLHIHKLGADVTESGCLELVRSILAGAAGGRPIRLFFIHDQQKNGAHPPRSIVAERAILSEFPQTTVVPYHSPRNTIDAVGAMDLLVTTKLHVGVVGRALEVPVVALGTHTKIGRFYGAIGEPDSCGTARSFATQGLPPRIRSSLASAQGRVRSPVSPEARASASGNREAVKDLLQALSRG